ncbi:MAG: hypothetical protein Q9213_000740 [Squamulea squamosa]
MATSKDCGMYLIIYRKMPDYHIMRKFQLGGRDMWPKKAKPILQEVSASGAIDQQPAMAEASLRALLETTAINRTPLRPTPPTLCFPLPATVVRIPNVKERDTTRGMKIHDTRIWVFIVDRSSMASKLRTAKHLWLW